MLIKPIRLIVLTCILCISGIAFSDTDETKTVTTTRSSNTSTKAMDAPAKNDQTGSSRTNSKDMTNSSQTNKPQKPKTYSERYRERYQSETYAKDYQERFKPENYRKDYQRNRRDYSRRSGTRTMPGEIRAAGIGYDDLTEEQKALFDLEQEELENTTEGQQDGLENPKLIDESNQSLETAPQPRMNTEHLYQLLQPPTNLARFKAQLNQQAQMTQSQDKQAPQQEQHGENTSQHVDEKSVEESVNIELNEDPSQTNPATGNQTNQPPQKINFTQMRNIELHQTGNASLSPKMMLFEEGFNALKFRRYSEAKRVFEQLHQMAPEDHEYQQALGLTSLLLGDHRVAAQWFFMDEPNQDSYPQWLLEAMRSRDVNFQVNRMQFQQDSNEQIQKLIEYIDTLRTY